MNEKVLLPGEESVATYQALQVDNQAGFSGVVTNRRLVFWQPGLLHDVRLDDIVALSWGRLRPPIWVAIVGGILALFGLATFGFGIGVLPFLLGAGMVAFWFLYRTERLVLYTTGVRAISVNGPNETLASLLWSIRSSKGS